MSDLLTAGDDTIDPIVEDASSLILHEPSNVDPNLIESAKRRIGRLRLQDAVRITPATFAHHITGGRWIPAKHLLYAAGTITAALNRGNAFIIFCMPPRHGKSELLSVHTPVWQTDKHPNQYTLLTTYAAPLAEGFGRRARDTILELNGGAEQEGETFLRCQLRKDALSVNNWHTTRGGGMFSVGIGGAITGRGTHLLLVDDYVKNAKEAASPQLQQDTYDWFTSTAMTRLEPGGSVLIFATRWDLNDLVGRLLLSEFADNIQVIRLPALAEEDDPLGRKPGEALWPERYSTERLVFLRQILGKYYFSALYQQRPIKRSEVDYKGSDLQVSDDLPHYTRLRYVRSWDLAASENKGDYTVGSLIARETGTPGATSNNFLVHQVRERLSPTRMEQVILQTAQLDGPDVPIALEQEPGASGKAYAEYLATTLLKGYTVDITPAQADKFLKAQPVLAAIENKRFKTIAGGWVEVSRRELEDFPAGQHDDIIDSWAVGYNYLNKTQPTGGVVWGRSSQGLIIPKSTRQVSQTTKQPARPTIVFGRSR